LNRWDDVGECCEVKDPINVGRYFEGLISGNIDFFDYEVLV
jgi:hypothetical protein